jgi:hypothetical protein
MHAYIKVFNLWNVQEKFPLDRYKRNGKFMDHHLLHIQEASLYQ